MANEAFPASDGYAKQLTTIFQEITVGHAHDHQYHGITADGCNHLRGVGANDEQNNPIYRRLKTDISHKVSDVFGPAVLGRQILS